MFYEPKRTTKLLEEDDDDTPRAIMIDQWIHTHTHNSRNSKNKKQSSCRTVSYDFSSSRTTSSETPSTYRSRPDHDDMIARREPKFMKSTKLKAMKLYADLKKVKQQPISPGSRISAFIYSLFASSSSEKKAKKIEESMQSFRSLKKSRSINNNNKQQQQQQDTTTTCTSFSRSCMSKKQQQHSNTTHHVKRSVRFYPDQNDTVIIHERGADSTPVPKYERRWFTENNYTKNYNNYFVVNHVEDDDEDEGEDDLFELEIVTSAYRQELPVFETTDLRKIRI
ncbi:uncharacterized protein LOC143565766 [Bidens hawaiensis]|uniref:uncharacterized protein LOC143565766 n=1 Tax=Bidens hawaiensis TaxID=980011 RepID=UPI00404A067D